MNRGHPRPIFRYSIGSLFLGVTVLAIWLGWSVNSAKRQRNAVQALRTVGCDVTYCSDLNATVTATGTADAKFVPTMTWRRRLADLFGVDLFQKVVGLNLYDEVTDDDLDVLRSLPAVEWLNLGTNVSDVGMRQVALLRKLRHLSLSPPVTDDGVRNLRHMSQLEVLDCSGTSISGEGLEGLIGLPALEHLYLSGSQVTDEGLAYIARLPQLVQLDLNDTRISDDGLAMLSSLTQLEDLSLSRTQTSDEGLVGLSGLNSLKSLSLKKTQVTGHGLRHLSDTQLRNLNLTYCDLTSEAVDALADISTLRAVYITNGRLPTNDITRLRRLCPKVTVTVVEDVDSILMGQESP